MVLLSRLKGGGAENRIWRTQFGFKTGCGTADAIFLARRLLDQAWASKDGKLILLALDWAKAFDSIAPKALLTALERFGLPMQMIHATQGIYRNRKFFVRDSGRCSAPRSQGFGISQGCPLSPFLFTILMTVLIHDAKRNFLAHPAYMAEHSPPVNELMYADDTLILEGSSGNAELFMQMVAAAGSNYGLSFNWKKLEALAFNCQVSIPTPEGPVKVKDKIIYLGSLLADDASIRGELGRRLGAAKADFLTLQRVWAHSSLSRTRKVRIFDACIVSKLMYCLHTAWLGAAERRKLNAFQNRCLRSILGIQHSMISRITNKTVLEQADMPLLSSTLLKRQLEFMGHIARQKNENALRQVVFKPDSFELMSLRGKRRKGRPRQSWAGQVFAHALLAAGGRAQLERIWRSTYGAWQTCVSSYCSNEELR